MNLIGKKIGWRTALWDNSNSMTHNPYLIAESFVSHSNYPLHCMSFARAVVEDVEIAGIRRLVSFAACVDLQEQE